MSSAQGIDVSSYQGTLTVSECAQYDFLFCKATDGGTMGVDPHFSSNWSTINAAGKWRGAYHELASSNVTGQAALFMTEVCAGGLGDGDMLAVVCSDYAVTQSEVEEFVQDVENACMANGTSNPIIIYSDESFLHNLSGLTSYALWIAYYSSSAPSSVSPWGQWAFWQYSDSPVDQDAFNGTVADLDAWLNSYKADPQGDEMTPSVAYWVSGSTTYIYHAVRGSDGLIYYMGPDNNYTWSAVATDTNCESGVDITVTPAGATYICYVNTSGAICQYYRAPGAQGGWQWQNLGGDVN